MPTDDKPNAPMTPTEYVELIVLPTLHEFLAARDDRRRAYLACLVVYHLADSLGLAEAARDPGFAELRGRPRRHAVDAATEAVQTEARRRCGEAFALVQGIANGTKHPARLPLLPGTEESVPAFALDTPGAGADEGRCDVPGLAFHADGEVWFLDSCAQQVLAAFVRSYPAHLPGIDPRSFMDPGLEVLGFAIEPVWLTGIAAWAAGKPEVAELWLFEARADAPPAAGGAVNVGLVLMDSEAEAVGGLTRAWASGHYTGVYEGWRTELAAITDQSVDLVLISRNGESGAQNPTPGQPRSILLWTRPAPTTAEPVSLSTR